MSRLSKSSLVWSAAVLLLGDDGLSFSINVAVGAGAIVGSLGSRKGFELPLIDGENDGLAGPEVILFLKGLLESRGEGRRSALTAKLAIKKNEEEKEDCVGEASRIKVFAYLEELPETSCLSANLSRHGRLSLLLGWLPSRVLANVEMAIRPAGDKMLPVSTRWLSVNADSCSGRDAGEVAR